MGSASRPRQKSNSFERFRIKFKENEPNDDRGHGTHCMGTIGGGNESGKAIGVAPKVKFVVAKIFDYEGKAYRSGILKAIQWMTNPMEILLPMTSHES